MRLTAEAVQVTRINRVAIITWLKRHHSAVRASFVAGGLVLQAQSEDVPRTALLGDWLVRSHSGEIFIVQAKLFCSLFVVTGAASATYRRNT